MIFCPNCGSQLNDDDAFCPNCGAPISQQNTQPAEPAQTVQYTQPAQPVQYTQPAYGQSFVPQRADHYDNGGLIAWSIITLLLCTIPGIVALVKATKINGLVTPDEQAKLIKDTKTWCTVGTILGVLAVIVSVIANLANY